MSSNLSSGSTMASTSTSTDPKHKPEEPPEDLWQVRSILGRKFNTKDLKFVLPADEEEFARLDAQHKILTMALDSLYACPEIVQPRLGPREGPAPGVLDLGCGSGAWAREMAEEFHFAEVLGIDVQLPPIEKADMPVNCRFEVDDMNLSIAHYAQCFDVVHCRAIDFYVSNYQNFLYEIARVLRPGGVLLLVYPVKALFDEHYDPLPKDLKEGEKGFSHLQRYLVAAHEASKARGYSEDAYLSYKTMLMENPNFDDDSISVKELHIPISPWPERMNEHDSTICDMMGRNMHSLAHSMRPLLVASGNPIAEVDRWLAELRKEIYSLSLRAYTRWIYAWAIRKPTPWVAPPSSAGASTS